MTPLQSNIVDLSSVFFCRSFIIAILAVIVASHAGLFRGGTKCDGIITNCDNLVHYKVRWTVITNCDSFFITKCDTVYNKLRQVLQTGDDYYKLRLTVHMSPKWRNLYDSLNYVDEFNQGDRFDCQPRSFKSRPKYQQYLQCL